ncbi:hypothetical protein [Paenibacillus puerhi]|uniref:hypothetical protein n=1 Tax=Paenibacillus puerhi TaxID=2692622 RepID=UPI0013580FDF|nr:hypothetical protein [Paenibacillus puerhi]
MMLSRLPGVIRHVNEGLDELRDTIDKMHSLCQTAEQMSPVLKQIAQMVAEVRQKAASAGPSSSRPIRLSDADGVPQKARKPRARRSVYRRATTGRR